MIDLLRDRTTQPRCGYFSLLPWERAESCRCQQQAPVERDCAGRDQQGNLGREIWDLGGLARYISDHSILVGVVVGSCPAVKSRDLHGNPAPNLKAGSAASNLDTVILGLGTGQRQQWGTGHLHLKVRIPRTKRH